VSKEIPVTYRVCSSLVLGFVSVPKIFTGYLLGTLTKPGGKAWVSGFWWLVGAGGAVAVPVKGRWRARVGFRGRVSGKTLSA
jgi:hypothetical protein